MKENLTNAGKKESRQIDRLLTKVAQEGEQRFGGKEVEAHGPKTAPPQRTTG